MQKQYKITQERYSELEKELHFLKTQREAEVADQIKEARKFGDLSENSEYDEAKNEQGKVFSRVAEIENILAGAVIIQVGQVSTETVCLGCRVVVEDLDSGERETYTIVGSQEANPMEYRVSDESPFGLALTGKAAGAELTLDVPAGKLRYRIIEILA
ncbi:MAG: transcription elongation factor GreA [Oscillospiraceae bacterium]|nr:transcription elongation factor GreA [Oscillospiraceae bacterium]